MGRKAPATMKVMRSPRQRAGSVMASPSAKPAMYIPSRTPKTCDNTGSGTTRCSNVRPETSIKGLPTPVIPTKRGARTRLGEIDHHESPPRSGAAKERRGQSSPGHEQRSQRRPHELTDPYYGVEEADSPAADVEQPKREHDEQDVEGTFHSEVSAHERDNQPRPALVNEHAETAEQVTERRTVMRAGSGELS